jgi:hypothetical protein
VIDPASRGRSQRDGTQLIEEYRKAGLNIEPADNAVEAGIYACEQLMSAGRLKIFTSLSNWYQEFRLYRRDENGKVVKERDHLMDAMRYLVKSGRDRMRTKPQPAKPELVYNYPGENRLTWMN